MTDITPPQQQVSTEALPIWMRQSLRGNDYGLLIVIAFCALLAWFYLVGPNLPRTNATENYVFQVENMATALQEGRLYPRWSPNANGGYGAPIPNFSPPGAPLTAGIIQALFVADAVVAVRLVFAGGLILAGVSVYLLVMRHQNAAAGVLAAVLYVYSPYIGLTAPHILGDLPGVLAAGLLPTLLWVVDRQMANNRTQDPALIALLFAALLLTDPKLAVVGAALAGFLVAWHAWQNRKVNRVALFFFGMVAGITLSAFYWLPALADQNNVRWILIPETNRTYQLTLGGLVAPFRQVDPDALVPNPQLTLGWWRVLVLGFTVVGIGRIQKYFSFELLQILLGIGLTVFAISTYPREIWLLTPITLCFSMASGAALQLRDRYNAQKRRIALAVVLIITLGASAPAWLPPDPGAQFGETSPAAQIEYEQQGFGPATLPPGYRMPTTLPPSVPINSSILENNADRVAVGQLSSSVQASALTLNTHRLRYQMSTSGQTDLQLLLAYFPGWRASLDGDPVPVTQDPENGLVRVGLGRAENEVLVIWLGTTRSRQIAWLLTGVTLTALLILTWGRYRRRGETLIDTPLLTLPEVRLLALLLGFSAVIILFTASPNAPFSLRESPGGEIRGTVPIRIRTDVGVSLTNHSPYPTRHTPGDTLPITLYWIALREVTQNYYVEIALTDNLGNIIRPGVRRFPGGYPTTRWQTNRFVADHHLIDIPENAPPGVYRIVVALTDCGNEICPEEKRASFFEESRGPIGRSVTLGQPVTIRAR